MVEKNEKNDQPWKHISDEIGLYSSERMCHIDLAQIGCTVSGKLDISFTLPDNMSLIYLICSIRIWMQLSKLILCPVTNTFL